NISVSARARVFERNPDPAPSSARPIAGCCRKAVLPHPWREILPEIEKGSRPQKSTKVTSAKKSFCEFCAFLWLDDQVLFGGFLFRFAESIENLFERRRCLCVLETGKPGIDVRGARVKLAGRAG